jgi:P protein
MGKIAFWLPCTASHFQLLQVSALASAFVDNIPLTTMMVKIAISLAENEALGLPLQPLVWALAFGACLGGKIVN